MSVGSIEEVNRSLGVRRSVPARVFLELAANIYGNDVLRRHIKTWVIPGRKLQDLRDPSQGVMQDECPRLMLWPEPRDGQPHTNITQQFTLSVECQLFVASVDPLDVLDFWGEVERAVYPETTVNGNSLRQRLYALGARENQVQISQPVLATPERSESGILIGTGSISVVYRIQGG